jgi:nucleotide-binding universal stress UspA family protein
MLVLAGNFAGKHRRRIWAESIAGQPQQAGGEGKLRILLAIEDSKFSEAATRMVVQKMRAEGAEVCILHVAEPTWLVLDYDLGGQLGQIEAAREENLERGKRLLARVEPVVAAAGFRVTTAMEEGDARFVIVDRAERWKADLTVVGSHGRKGLGRLLLGSVAEHVARHAHCSVLIVRCQDAEPDTKQDTKE